MRRYARTYMGNTHSYTWNKNSRNSTRWNKRIVQRMRARTHGKRICIRETRILRDETRGLYREGERHVGQLQFAARVIWSVLLVRERAVEHSQKNMVKIYQFTKKNTIWSVLRVGKRVGEYSQQKSRWKLVKIYQFAPIKYSICSLVSWKLQKKRTTGAAKQTQKTQVQIYETLKTQLFCSWTQNQLFFQLCSWSATTRLDYRVMVRWKFGKPEILDPPPPKPRSAPRVNRTQKQAGFRIPSLR